MRSMRWPGMILCAVILASGCARPDEGPVRATRIRHRDVQPQYNNVAFLDRDLEKRIEVQGSEAERTPTNTVGVTVRIRNRTNFPQQVECRISFYDRDKVPLGEASAWQRVTLDPNEITVWRESSLTPDAAYYYVEIREGRR